jgi:hypothetical protein
MSLIAIVIMIGIISFNRWRYTKGGTDFMFSENLASNLDDAIQFLETKYGYNITTTEAIEKVRDENSEWVTKTIYFISIPNKGLAALDSDGNLYFPLIVN